MTKLTNDDLQTVQTALNRIVGLSDLRSRDGMVFFDTGGVDLKACGMPDEWATAYAKLFALSPKLAADLLDQPATDYRALCERLVLVLRDIDGMTKEPATGALVRTALEAVHIEMRNATAREAGIGGDHDPNS